MQRSPFLIPDQVPNARQVVFASAAAERKWVIIVLEKFIVKGCGIVGQRFSVPEVAMIKLVVRSAGEHAVDDLRGDQAIGFGGRSLFRLGCDMRAT